MRKKIMRRYILLAIPFICGCLLYGIGLYGIVSSLLFFCGGYVLFKNIFDYRMINKNIKKCIDDGLNLDNSDNDKDFLLFNRGKLDSVNVLGDEISNNIIGENMDNCDKYKYEYRKSDNILGLKTTRLHSKVRRRY